MTNLIATRQALALALGLCTASACYDNKTEPTPSELTSSKPSQSPEALPEGSIQATLPQLSAAELTPVVATIEPQKARNGDLRFSDARLDTPAAAPLLIERLQQGRDDDATQHALILALPRTQGSYAAEALELYKVESSETLRAALIDSMRLAKDAVPALKALELGLSDSSAQVRARAAFNIGRRADGLSLVNGLTAAVADSDTSVQTAAARALGQLGASQAFDTVVPLLQSRSADARLESVRALARMDGKRAAALPELVALSADSDERVRTAVAKAQAGGY